MKAKSIYLVLFLNCILLEDLCLFEIGCNPSRTDSRYLFKSGFRRLSVKVSFIMYIFPCSFFRSTNFFRPNSGAGGRCFLVSTFTFSLCSTWQECAKSLQRFLATTRYKSWSTQSGLIRSWINPRSRIFCSFSTHTHSHSTNRATHTDRVTPMTTVEPC